MRFLRKSVGWGVGAAYALTGARGRALRRYDDGDAVLGMFGHDMRPDVLEGSLRWLRNHGFSFIGSDELVDRVNGGAGRLSGRTAWLSFDDGWAGFEAQLLPLLERLEIPATIFVAPNETRRGHIWTNAMFERKGEAGDWLQDMYRLPADERYAVVGPVRRRLATEDELRRLSRHPLITLENHTWTHLSCRDRPCSEVMDEVRRTQEELAAWTGRSPRLVCYPFGKHTGETDSAIRAEGLIPVWSMPGDILSAEGFPRNMMVELATDRENVGRLLRAWPKIGETV